MNFARLAIVIPMYILIVGTLEQSGISRTISSLQLTPALLWATEIGALLVGGAGIWLFQRQNGILERNPSLLNATLSHALIGLVFSAAFGIYSLFSGQYPYLPGLIILPLAFGISELGYILIMRAWYDRKARQQDFHDDLK